MIINHGRVDGQPSDQRGPTFTGQVWAEPLLSPTEGVAVNTVFFPPGARTHWHTHATGQILMVTHGAGFVRNDAGEGGPLRPGDVVWISPGERHWHGAGPDTYLTHIAISLGDADWQDAVDDADYDAARG
ncbi:cupin domain-containing protein [Baekduia soli]|uniref:Cupin domain-containing protein n=1 Tax=Baekduia soli TaxID=496014 RepID=A0A5B8U636_9ACTN|nr:cupin domain-containing protein [Baekduia soli]QEC48447.1 cupin domain-containing protein [Baekduia soli]